MVRIQRGRMKTLLRYSVNLVPVAMRTWIKHIPGVAGFQRMLVNELLSGEPFTHTISGGPATGLRFEVTLPMDKAIWSGTYESEFAGEISREIKQGDVCYDVGGYRGYMSGVMALAGAAKVFVFEPLPANQRALQRICVLNPDLNIEMKPFAMGDSDGVIRLRVMSDASMGKLVTSSFQPEAAATDEIEVAIRRLDSMVDAHDIPAPQLMKIDVEGAELDVLRGAARILESHRPRIFLEAHSAALEEACSRHLVGLGYKVSRLEANPADDEHTRHLIARPRNG